jgi:hypothetical protein
MECQDNRNKRGGNRDNKKYDVDDIEFDSEDNEILEKKFQDMCGGNIDIDARSFTMDKNYMRD